jgi:integrase
MARAPYLGRREGGRYYLQIRLGKRAQALYGRNVLRASLRTSDYAEARRRLVDNLGWAREVADAPDLDVLGTALHARLTAYTDQGAPGTERVLAERVAFENQVRSFLTRSNERGYPFGGRLDGFASRWVDFVNQNKAAEEDLIRIGLRREYERGRADAGEAAVNGWSAIHVAPPPPSPAAATVRARIPELPADVGQLIEIGASSLPGPEASLQPEPPSATVAPRGTAVPGSARLSDVLELFYADKKKNKKDDRARGEYGPVMSFMVAFFDDAPIDAITPDDFARLDDALPEVPDRKGIPKAACESLMSRYTYAQANGWDKLKRLTETTIRGYHMLISAFFRWAKRKGHYHGEVPKLEQVSEENLTALPRDAFEDDELLALVQLPLFTGCQGLGRMWQQGLYFVQNHIYWAFLVLILSGMRPGEVGRIRCRDVVTDGEFYFFDLRPFDARKGRVALKDLRNLKTSSSGRVVPIHPLLIDLGLLDRVHDLEALGIEMLFPEWTPYRKSTGELRWGQPITKSWQYVKKLLGITRADLTLYGTRHWMADMLDNDAIAQRTRNRILGHVSSVPDGYGRKGMLKPEQSAAIAKLEPPVIMEMRKILMAAKERAGGGELTVLKPWLAGGSEKQKDSPTSFAAT